MPPSFRSLLLAAPLVLAACSEAPPAGVTPTASAPAATNTPAPVSPPATQPPPPAASSAVASPAVLAMAKGVYDNQCVACHGSTGRGDGTMSRSLPIKPRSFAADEWRLVDFAASATEVQATIESVLRKGIPDAMMPGYASSLSDEKIDALVQYVLELRRQGREG